MIACLSSTVGNVQVAGEDDTKGEASEYSRWSKLPDETENVRAAHDVSECGAPREQIGRQDGED